MLVVLLFITCGILILTIESDKAEEVRKIAVGYVLGTAIVFTIFHGFDVMMKTISNPERAEEIQQEREND